MSLSFGITEAEGLVIGVLDTSRQEESSTQHPTDDISLPANERVKGVGEEGYEIGSDVDAGDLKMTEEGFTQLEVRLDVSTRIIRSLWIMIC